MASSGLGPDAITRLFTIYLSTDDIAYSANDALCQCKLMAETLQSVVRACGRASLGKRRSNLWEKKLNGLLQETLPTTRIGLYGASGAGKSSVINALLDGNIVTTSSFGAGTSVVTEISYQHDSHVVADVSFISRDRWESVISAVLDAIKDNDSPSNFSEAGENDGSMIAWSQVEAAYPHLTLEMMSRMSIQDVLASDREIMKILETSRVVSAEDARTFSRKMGHFLGAGNIKAKNIRGRSAAGATRAVPNLLEMLGEMPPRDTHSYPPTGSTIIQDSLEFESRPKTEGALWPLIERASIRCNAPVLSTGAILVDMPGTSDKNRARSRIAMDNLASCDKIWIFAPIVRAVTDKISSDLLGETFQRQLSMDRSYDAETITFIATKIDDISCTETIDQLALAEDPGLQELEERSERYQVEIGLSKDKQTDIRENREEIIRQLQAAQGYLDEQMQRLFQFHVQSQKRKGSDQAPQGSAAKRMKVETASNTYVQSESDAASSQNTVVASDDLKATQERISKAKEVLAVGQKRLDELEAQDWEVTRALLVARAEKLEVDKEKRAFCSVARSERSRVLLQEGFNQGLKDFHRLENLLEESADLPVFCTCATDYAKITGLNTSDGESACFIKPKDTGIPALQSWCRSLAETSQDAASRDILERLKCVAESICGWIEYASKGDDLDSIVFQQKWDITRNKHQGEAVSGGDHLNSISGRLKATFSRLLLEATEDLKAEFKDGLKTVCKEGASAASGKALTIASESLNFKTVNHQTVSATLKRHGAFRFHPNLNEALAEPMLQIIEPEWADVFHGPFLESLNDSINGAVKDFLGDISGSAARGFQARLQKQVTKSINETRVTIFNQIQQACDVIDLQQKKLSRSIPDHIQEKLYHGYDRAIKLNVKGTRSTVKRRKAFLDFLERHQDQIFSNAANKITENLSEMVNTIALDLKAGLDGLAEEIELNIAVLWGSVRKDPTEVRIRAQALEAAQQVVQQVEFWQEAEKKHAAEAAVARETGAAGFPGNTS